MHRLFILCWAYSPPHPLLYEGFAIRRTTSELSLKYVVGRRWNTLSILRQKWTRISLNYTNRVKYGIQPSRAAKSDLK